MFQKSKLEDFPKP